jgi:hypothetical protein
MPTLFGESVAGAVWARSGVVRTAAALFLHFAKKKMTHP